MAQRPSYPRRSEAEDPMTTPTERRLAITPGTWEWITQAKMEGREQTALSANAYTDDSTTVLFHNAVWMPKPDDLTLIADAGTTYNSCRLTPSELLAKLREAQDVVVHMVSAAKYHFKHGNDTNLDKQTDIADAFLSNLNLPK